MWKYDFPSSDGQGGDVAVKDTGKKPADATAKKDGAEKKPAADDTKKTDAAAKPAAAAF